MSKRVSLVVIDDLDGSQNAHTVSFGLDGDSYEIDLSDENRAELEQVLAPFISVARRVPRGGRPGQKGQQRTGQQSGYSVDRAAVREWARSASVQVSERGRISGFVLREYEVSQAFGLGGDERGD